MTKKGPLSKAEVFYINSHCEEVSSKDLAKELDRAISSVETQIEKYNSEKPQESPPTAGDMMARNDNGAVVMTETASQMADSTRKSGARNRKDCVSRIK